MNVTAPHARRRQFGSISLVLLALVLGSVSLRHVWAPQEPAIGRVLGLLSVVGLALPLLGGGIWLWTTTTPLEGNDVSRILGWCCAGMVPLVVFAVLIVDYERHHGIRLAEPAVVVLWVAGVGAVGGLLTGIHDVRRRHVHRRHRATAERLSSLIDAAPVPIIEHDPDGTVRRWNDEAERVFGWREDEVVGDTLPFLDDEESRAEFAAHMERVISGEQLTNVEIRRRTKDGERRDFLLSTAPVYDDSETLTAIIGILVDVTEQERRREQLELFRTLLDHSNDSIFLVDVETGEFVDVNETACEQLGYDRSDLLDLSVTDVETTISTEEEWQAHAETVREEGSVLHQGRHQRSDGSTFPVEINVTHVHLDREYAVAVVRDVTAREERERELEKLREAVEHAGHAIYITDTDGRIQYANPAFGEVTGYDPDEVVGEDPSILQSDEHDEEYYRRLWETISGGDVWEEDIVNQRKSGELYTAHQTIAPIRRDEGDDDTIVGYVAIQIDKTGQAIRKQRISVLNRVLRHNLRSALTVISGHVRKLLDEVEGDERRYAATIERKARELEQLSEKAQQVTEILDNGSRRARPVPLDEVLDRVVATTDADITVYSPDDTVLVDGTVELALGELVENAIEHTDRARPSVRLTATVDWSNDQASIAVEDDGPGIPEIERATLREGAETQLRHGSGLGLWLVKWLTTELGGKVAIDDNDPRGSVVTVTVPILSTIEDTLESKTPHPSPENRDRLHLPQDDG